MNFFTNMMPKLDSGELEESPLSKSPDIVSDEPTVDHRGKIFLFDRSDSSIYMERGSISATSDAQLSTITIKNAFFETLILTQNLLGNKPETCL